MTEDGGPCSWPRVRRRARGRDRPLRAATPPSRDGAVGATARACLWWPAPPSAPSSPTCPPLLTAPASSPPTRSSTSTSTRGASSPGRRRCGTRASSAAGSPTRTSATCGRSGPATGSRTPWACPTGWPSGCGSARLLFAAGTGVLVLARLLACRWAGAFVAAVAYGLSPYLLSYVNRTSVLLRPWAGLGWMVASAILAARRGGWRWPALFALVVATVGGINATALVLCGLAPVLWLAHAAWVSREVPVRRVLAAAGRIGLLTLAASAWWIVALVVQARYGADVLAYSETLESVSTTSLASEVVRGLGLLAVLRRRRHSAAGTAPSPPYLTAPAADRPRLRAAARRRARRSWLCAGGNGLAVAPSSRRPRRRASAPTPSTTPRRSAARAGAPPQHDRAGPALADPRPAAGPAGLRARRRGRPHRARARLPAASPARPVAVVA